MSASPGEWLGVLAIGVGFGAALERSGLGSARKLVGQFHLTDLTVFKVMFSALVTAMVGVFWLGVFGWIDLSRLYVPETFLAPQLAGGLVFGAGFALAGLCPGTSCVSAASGRGDGAVVVAGLFAGVLATGFAYPRLAAFYGSSARGVLTLPEAGGVSYGLVVLTVVLLALGGFALAERVERRSPAAPRGPVRPVHFALAILGLVLGGLAAWHGGPGFVAPVELARWLRARQPGLELVDLRSGEEFAAAHVPGASNRSATGSSARLVLTGGRWRDGILPRGALVLRGGVEGWETEVLAPALPDDAPAEVRAHWHETAALSRYFGGTPRIGSPAPVRGWRRGC